MMFAVGVTVGLAEKIIDDIFFCIRFSSEKKI